MVPAAQKYLSIRLLGLPAFIAGTVLQAACLAAKDSTTPLLILTVAGMLNLGLDLWLVNVVGLGIGGAAIATLISQLVQTLLLGIAVQRKRAAVLKPGGGWALVGRPPSPKQLLAFLTFAGPIFLVLLGKISCYNAMTLAATSGGVVSLAAHQVISCPSVYRRQVAPARLMWPALTTHVPLLTTRQVMVSIFFLGCKFGDAVSQTAQAFLPSCLGERGLGTSASPPAQRLSRRLLRLSTFLGAFVSLLAYGFVTRCSRVFTTDAAVTSAIASAAPLLFIALVAHASCMCSEGLLMGARQLQFLARAYAFNVAVFLSALYFVARRAMGLNAVWSALAVFQYVRLTQFLSRSRQLGMLRDADES